MPQVHIDFETRGLLDIKKVGALLYLEDVSAAILCVAFCVDDDPVMSLRNTEGKLRDVAISEYLRDWASRPDYMFVAHNAGFEIKCWSEFMVFRYGFPPIPNSRWKCTMAKAFSYGIPGNLEGAAKAMRLPFQKDVEGAKVMMKLSKPKRKSDVFWEYKECPDDFEKLYEYCRQDVETERALDKALRDLPKTESRIWQIDLRMNQEGIYLDTDTIRKAIEFGKEEKINLHGAFGNLVYDEESGAGIKPTQRNQIKLWLAERGVQVKDTTASTMKRLIEDPELPEGIRNSLSLVTSANKTSLAKYEQMLTRSNEQGLLRETLNYHGAHTGRWTGRGVQVQNFPRPRINIENCIDAINLLDYEGFSIVYDDVNDALSSALRGMIIAPPGFRMFVADLSQMEARVLAWLAGQQDVLDLFASGEDLYCYAASQIYGRTITKSDKDERFVGKVAVLALGYQGGINAFATMANAYGVNLLPIYRTLWNSSSYDERTNAEYCYMLYLKQHGNDDPVSKEVAFVADIIKQRWRSGNEKIQQFWGDIEGAAIRAVRSGVPVSSGRLVWFTNTLFLHCKLPSGRITSYPYPKVEEGSRGKLTLSYVSAKYGRTSVYGGKLAENVTQAVQRDILRDAIIRLEDVYPVQFHVHDEMISYVRDGYGDIDEFVSIVKEVPTWADGIPIDAAGWEGTRYGKE